MTDDSTRVPRDLRQARHEYEWELFQLLECVPVGIYVVTAAGTPYYANRPARLMLGLAEVPDHVSRFSEVYQAYETGTDTLYPTERLPLTRALRGEACEISDLEVRRGGERVALHVSGAPVKIGGDIAFAVAALQDIREIRRIANRDALTGLPNRTVVGEAFARERLFVERGDRALAVAVIDFDRFKSVNDTHGHAVGDEVLRRGAAAIVEALRQTDVVARWGGEELVVVLPDTPLDGAVRALEGALDAVRTLDVAGVHVTFSAGVTDVAAGESLEAVVARADAALYEAKRAGRDRVLAAPR